MISKASKQTKVRVLYLEVSGSLNCPTVRRNYPAALSVTLFLLFYIRYNGRRNIKYQALQL